MPISNNVACRPVQQAAENWGRSMEEANAIERLSWRMAKDKFRVRTYPLLEIAAAKLAGAMTFQGRPEQSFSPVDPNPLPFTPSNKEETWSRQNALTYVSLLPSKTVGTLKAAFA